MHTLIVGSTSEIAIEFIKNNIEKNKKYILTDLEEKCEELRNIVKELKVEAHIFPLDVLNIKEIETLFCKISESRIIISEVIYVAGINYLVDAIDMSEEIWDKVISVNLKGCFFVMKEAAKNMIVNDVEGSMVNISSQHGVVGNIQRAPYCASKAGIINLNKSLAIEWAQYNIRVNSVSPTFILYDKNKNLLMSDKFKRSYLRNIPLRSYCSSKDVVSAINFLLSKENKMITGHNLVVDGGWTIK